MPQTTQVRGIATHIRHAGDFTLVFYHNTAVVRFDATKIWLNSGGWRTPTTKLRMNQAASQFNLGYRVYQHDFAWYVKLSDNDQPLIFSDGMVFARS